MHASAQLGERAGFQQERLTKAAAHKAQAARLGLAAEAGKAARAQELAERALQARSYSERCLCTLHEHRHLTTGWVHHQALRIWF